MYKRFIRPVLFKFEPEFVHDSINLVGRFMGFTRLSRLLRWMFVYKNQKNNGVPPLLSGGLRQPLVFRIFKKPPLLRGGFPFENDKLVSEVLGVRFENPIGLAAGFDKNAQLTNFIPDLGFGFMEIGSVTADACEGNAKPRLHRLVKGEGIIVNYGLANKGAEEISSRLNGKKFRIPMGINIAKTNDSSIKGDASIEDYFKGFELMKGIGDYFTINISCPNVGDGRSFEDVELLERLLRKISGIRDKEIIFLKISPDIVKENLDKIINLAGRYGVDGFVVSNLTKDRKGMDMEGKEEFKGGISGKFVESKSNKLIRYVYKKTNRRFVIIGCGGVFSGEDAYEKIKSGASLIQLISGLIFEGPSVVKKINKELVELLERDGYESVGKAVGSGVWN